MDLKNKIKQLSEKYYQEVKEIREHLHKNPELSFQEYKTSEFVCKKLNQYKIPYKKYVKTGIVADINGISTSYPRKTIALRADMDALPITEKNEIPYKSVNEGIMHACGHDVHTACLLGTAKILQELKHQFTGTVRLIFQPGEERNPGGAKLMLEENALKDNEPELIIGQHVFPDLPAGEIGFRKGMYMASTDEIYITIKGKGGHGAIPNELTDSVLIASHIIIALQQIVSRNIPAHIPAVLSFGKVEAKGETNIIAEKVKIEGTFRTMNEEWREKALELIKKIARNTAEGMGAKCHIYIDRGYPFLINHNELTEFAVNKAKEILDEKNIHELKLRMTGEDFAFFAQKYPATFYRLGVGNSELKNYTNLHSPTFNINDKALEKGINVMSWLAISAMQTNKKFEPET